VPPPLADTTGPDRRRVPWGLVAAAAIVTTAAVVGAVMSSAPRSASASTRILAAASRTQAARTAQFTSTISLSTGGPPVKAVEMTGSSDLAAGATETKLVGTGQSETVRYVDGVEYVQWSVLHLPPGARWVRILPSDLGVTSVPVGSTGNGDPTQGLQFLGGLVGQPGVIGPDTVGGTAVIQYHVELDLQTLFAKLGQAGSHLSPAFAKGFQVLQNSVNLARVPADVWLDAQGRVRRFDLTLALHTSRGSITEVSSTTFSAFGGPVNVETPPPSQTVSFATVKTAFASLFPGSKPS
jgi:hypothetical protein